MSESIDQRLTSVEQKVTNVDKNVESIITSLNGVAETVNNLAGTVNHLLETVNGIRSCNCNLSAVQQLTNQLGNLMKNCRDIAAKNQEQSTANRDTAILQR